jgi:UDPglucose 6-dehydrogenase
LKKKGFNILGYDIKEDYINSLNNKTYKSDEPTINEMLISSKNFNCTIDINYALNFSKIVYIMINTPCGKNEKGYIHDNLNEFFITIKNKNLCGYHFIIGCSVNPGYFKTELPSLVDLDKNSVSYNPQFVPLGDLVNKFLNPDIVLIGESNKERGDELENIYKNVCDNTPKICRMTLESSEIVKFAIASFVTYKISFANFIGDLSDKTPNSNKFDILNAVGTDMRIGEQCLKPGYGYGGPCFPRDNNVLIKYAKKLNIPYFLCEASHNFNEYHAYFIAEQFKAQKKINISLKMFHLKKNLKYQ